MRILWVFLPWSSSDPVRTVGSTGMQGTKITLSGSGAAANRVIAMVKRVTWGEVFSSDPPCGFRGVSLEKSHKNCILHGDKHGNEHEGVRAQPCQRQGWTRQWMQIKAQKLSLNTARHHFTVRKDRLPKRFPRELLEFAFVEVLRGKWETVWRIFSPDGRRSPEVPFNLLRSEMLWEKGRKTEKPSKESNMFTNTISKGKESEA